MKKVLLIILISLFVKNAKALPAGIYWGIRGGTTIQDGKVKNIKNFGIENEKSNYFTSINTGIRFFKLRTEVEYAYRANSTKIKEEFKNRDIAAKNLMANAYYNILELPLLNLYLNAGLGNTMFSGTSQLKTRSNLTWLAGFGVNLSILNITNFDIGYRYVDMGDLKIKDGGETSKKSHDIYIGIRFGI